MIFEGLITEAQEQGYKRAVEVEVQDSTNSANNPYGGNSQPMRNTSIVNYMGAGR